MKKLLVLLIGLSVFVLSCTDAEVVSNNISKAADQFEIYRRVVFLNGITDTYILSIEGYCSIMDNGTQLKVTVKTGPGKFIKHYLGLSDNVTYFAEQLESSSVSDRQYRVIFKPSAIIPNIEVKWKIICLWY